MIERILPAEAVAVEAFDDPAGVTLFPEEERFVAAAVTKRRREFTTARHCARQALAALGMDPVPILPGHRGAPQWPTGVVGSMTHCQGYRAAVLARDTDLVAIGVDAEPHEPLPAGVFAVVAGEAERARSAGLTASYPDHCWDRLLFCAKEAVYKAWFPLTGRWLDFTEADVAIDPDTGTFRAHLLVPGPELAGTRIGSFAGRFRIADGLIVTAVSLPTAHRRRAGGR